VRNSVKAVVDAYDGSVTLYVVDPDDPIVRAWMSAFPDLFTTGDEMPAELRSHLRYPEDLFRVQTNVYSKYHLDPALFFEREGAWSVAQAPSVAPREAPAIETPQQTTTDGGREPALATETSNLRFVPYYTMFGGGERREFVLMRPFVPFSSDDARRELQAFMTASSEPDTYGQLTVYVVDPGETGLPDGPLSIANTMESDPAISREVTVQNQQRGGSRVRFGDLQLVNIADGLLWVRPFYVGTEQDGGVVSSVIEYAFIMAAYDENAAYSETLGGALAQLFPGLDIDLGERSDTASEPVAEVDEAAPAASGDGEGELAAPGSAGSPTDPGAASGTPAALLAEADQLLRTAEEQLRVDGDLGEYQQRVDEAAALVSQALAQLGADASASTAPPASEPTEATGAAG
jgi:uncharacterized membrane protein (UPF0182 family)